jgi:hypothetical protein
LKFYSINEGALLCETVGPLRQLIYALGGVTLAIQTRLLAFEVIRQIPGRIRHYKSYYSELPSTSKTHNVLWVVLLSDLAQPLYVHSIHPLHRSPDQCVVGVWCCVLQVLAIPDSCLKQCRGRDAHGIGHVLVS